MKDIVMIPMFEGMTKQGYDMMVRDIGKLLTEINELRQRVNKPKQHCITWTENCMVDYECSVRATSREDAMSKLINHNLDDETDSDIYELNISREGFTPSVISTMSVETLED